MGPKGFVSWQEHSVMCVLGARHVVELAVNKKTGVYVEKDKGASSLFAAIGDFLVTKRL